ncbi:hypothetical protein pipiens_002037 [Culex pipiens pipiens]|uniref:Uncharacterized protein n=1 Tax=Culex pipiens pipiens TaxID=38569 RepID=A0ABD1DLT8_CULPP
MDEFAIIPVREAVFCPTRSPAVVVDVISGSASVATPRTMAASDLDMLPACKEQLIDTIRLALGPPIKMAPGTSAVADIAGVFYKGIGKIFGSTTRCKIRHKDGPVAIAGICDQETNDL